MDLNAVVASEDFSLPNLAGEAGVDLSDQGFEVEEVEEAEEVLPKSKEVVFIGHGAAERLLTTLFNGGDDASLFSKGQIVAVIKERGEGAADIYHVIWHSSVQKPADEIIAAQAKGAYESVECEITPNTFAGTTLSYDHERKVRQDLIRATKLGESTIILDDKAMSFTPFVALNTTPVVICSSRVHPSLSGTSVFISGLSRAGICQFEAALNLEISRYVAGQIESGQISTTLDVKEKPVREEQAAPIERAQPPAARNRKPVTKRAGTPPSLNSNGGGGSLAPHKPPNPEAANGRLTSSPEVEARMARLTEDLRKRGVIK